MSRSRRRTKKMQAAKLEMSEAIVENITVKMDVRGDDLKQS